VSHQNYKNSQNAHANGAGYGQNVDKAANVFQVKNYRRNNNQKPSWKLVNFVIVSEHAFHIHRQSDKGSEHGQKTDYGTDGHYFGAHHSFYAGKRVHRGKLSAYSQNGKNKNCINGRRQKQTDGNDLLETFYVGIEKNIPRRRYGRKSGQGKQPDSVGQEPAFIHQQISGRKKVFRFNVRKRKKQQINDKPDYRHRQIKINFGDSVYFKQGHQPARSEKQQGHKLNGMPVEQTGEISQKNPAHNGVNEQRKIIGAKRRKQAEKLGLLAQIHFHIPDKPVPPFSVKRNFPIPLMQKINDKKRNDQVNRSPKNAGLGERVRQSENAGPYYQAGHHSYSFYIQPGHLLV